MQRVSAFLPSWDKRNSGSGSKPGTFFGRRASQPPPPPNGLAKINTETANLGAKKVQREAFWPATLDLECDKAARILKSFCVDGYFAPTDNDAPASPSSTSTGIKTLDQVPKKIPRRVIQNAAGIAVFTCMRSGLWMTGSGGSGILIARKSDGTWSPPSGIMLHTPSLSFIIGVDVYDCVLIISSHTALESVTRPRLTLGEDVELRAGETVSLGAEEISINWKELDNTVLTYMKARGQQQSVNLYGCMLSERTNENERFYASDVTHMDILAGNVSRDVQETTALNEVLKMAEGRSDYDSSVINRVAAEPAPSDALISTATPPKTASIPSSPHSSFGLPQADDPDPFGILALEMAGLEIREAGSRIRPTSSLFDMNQNPMSPVASSKRSRQSVDTFVSRSNRGSYVSMRTIRSQVTDAGTQTDTGNTPETSPSPGPSAGSGRASPAYIPVVKEEDEEEEEEEKEEKMVIPPRSANRLSKDVAVGPDSVGQDSVDEDELSQGDTESLSESLRREEDAMSHGESSEEDELFEDEDEDDDDDSDEEFNDDADDEDDIEEEPVVFEVAAVQRTSAQMRASGMIQARGNVVTIAKRVPPPLPTRSPARMSRIAKKDASGEGIDLQSPLSQTFSSDGDLDSQDADANSIDAAVTQPEIEHSVSEESDAAEEPREDEVSEMDESSADEAELEVLVVEPHHNEQADHSDAASNEKKHTSSIFTGVTEDRWSCDGSSVTTPTSERRFSLTENQMSDDAAKKTMHERVEEIDDSPSATTEAAHAPMAAAN
ncbi:hypothetical protein ACQKWADRAFT_306710 [Trichoderma austrokoningii]